jgi:hypothetical protein
MTQTKINTPIGGANSNEIIDNEIIDDKNNVLDGGNENIIDLDTTANDGGDGRSNPDNAGVGDNNLDQDAEVTIQDLEQLSGIQLFDENNNRIEFDLSLESLAKREKLIKDTFIREGAKNYSSKFFEENPDIKAIYEHKLKTGTVEGFSYNPKYSEIELNKEDSELLKNIIREAERLKGNDVEDTEDLIKFLEIENKIEDRANKSHSFLVAYEQKQDKSKEDKLVAQRTKQIEQESEFYGTYYDNKGQEIIVGTANSIYDKIVNQGKFSSFVIPEDGIVIDREQKKIRMSRKDIYDYISKPVKNGWTQAMIDHHKRHQNKDILIMDYFVNLTGGNIDSLIQRKVLETKARNLKITRSVTSTTTNSGNQSSQNIKLKLPVVK